MSAQPTIGTGQKWLNASGVAWTVQKRRSRAIGPVENLLVSPNGARRWLSDPELRESFTLAEGD